MITSPPWATPWLKGRFFSRDFLSDSSAVILNETAMKLMNIESYENQTILSYNYETPRPMKIIGVVKDFNFETLRNTVKPFVFTLGGEPNGEMAIRLAAGDKTEQLELLQTI
jgi:putative ABC transport system permease protein